MVNRQLCTLQQIAQGVQEREMNKSAPHLGQGELVFRELGCLHGRTLCILFVLELLLPEQRKSPKQLAWAFSYSTRLLQQQYVFVL